MKRILAAALVLSMLAVSSFFCAPAALAQVGVSYYVIVDKLPVYSYPNTNAFIVGTLRRFDKIRHERGRVINGMWNVRAKGGFGFVSLKTASGEPTLTRWLYEKGRLYSVCDAKHIALRVSPKYGSPVISYIKKNGVVLFGKRTGRWGKVTAQTGEIGRTGWVPLKYLKPYY